MTKTTDKLLEIVALARLKGANAPRSYLGTSGLGESCDRALWYSYKQPKNPDKAIVFRKFDVGHALEPVLINWLKTAGITFFDSPDGNQFGFEDGVIQGHVDGVIKGIPYDEDTAYLFEAKTSNEHYFKNFVKEGIQCNEKYLIQVHVYMHKMHLKKCLFAVVNKNTQDLYFEIVELDEFIAISALNRGHAIAEMEEIPDRKYETKAYFKCKLCSYYSECWKQDQ